MPKAKKKGGRPSKYKPEYPAELSKHFGKGGSYEAFAGVVGVAIQTLYDWEKRHPEFLAAKQEGVSLSQHVWEQIGMAGMTGKISGFNATVWIFNMKNRFGWRDARDVKTSL